MTNSHQLVDHFFRHEFTRLVAVLAKSLGIARLDLIEDVVQSALLKALQVWSRQGVPSEPGAWLYQTAKNLALDSLRKESNRDRLLQKRGLPAEGQEPNGLDLVFEGEIEDAPLRLMFVCCHEEIPVESRIALALKNLCGFGLGEIARALLTTPANAEKRITRAREKLRELATQWDDIPLETLTSRVDSVLAVIYLLFNEGYHASHADVPIRIDLCDEAIRLTRMLVHHPLGKRPQVEALLSLLLFHSARFPSRVAPDGGVVLLEDQNRAEWDWGKIREGMRWMAQSARGDQVSRFHLESAIAWEHCRARTFSETDWKKILELYHALQSLAPSWVHTLNGAIALSFVEGPQAALDRLASVDGATLPRHYPLWHAVKGQLHFQAEQYRQAEAAWMEALKNTFARSDQDLLRAKLARCRRFLAAGHQSGNDPQGVG